MNYDQQNSAKSAKKQQHYDSTERMTHTLYTKRSRLPTVVETLLVVITTTSAFIETMNHCNKKNPVDVHFK